MKPFFKSLLRADGETSSKRFTALITLLLLTACVIANLFGIQVDSNIIYTLGGIICASLGMTMVQQTQQPINIDDKG